MQTYFNPSKSSCALTALPVNIAHKSPTFVFKNGLNKLVDRRTEPTMIPFSKKQTSPLLIIIIRRRTYVYKPPFSPELIAFYNY